MPESEIWEDVVGFEGLYKISNKGNLYSVERRDVMGRKWGGRKLKLRDHTCGYIQVNLSKNGEMKSKLIHRLVAEAFIPNPNNFSEVNHLDENKINNELSNLEWCDTSYNNNHGTRNRRIGQKLSKKMKAVNVKTGEVITFSSGKEAINKGYSRAVYEACRGDYYDGHLYRGHKWSYE